jgi:toxin ParE1/3/4
MKVQWTVPAVDDLGSIRDYIARDSDFYAARFVEKILDTVELLMDFPEMGRVVPEADDINVREILFQNFRIMYRIQRESVHVVAIIRGSRDIGKWPLKPWEIA